MLSPRMRGWSCVWWSGIWQNNVIPANAGVILIRCPYFPLLYCCPRECGGDSMRRRPDGVGAVIPADAGRFDWYDNIINWNGECITITVSFLVMEFVFNRIKLFFIVIMLFWNNLRLHHSPCHPPPLMLHWIQTFQPKEGGCYGIF